jgi:hypothetical protein
MRIQLSLLLCTALLNNVSLAAAHSTNSLGTGVAADLQGRLWTVGVEPGDHGNVISIAAVADPAHPKIRVTSKPEPASADGENRPKLAFGPKGEMYVSWTSPTSEHYTGDIHFSRSLDQGKHWSAPTTVHRDRQVITHRFDSLAVDGKGRVWVAWIDKRDQALAEKEHREYAGAAIYYAYSEDQGAHWKGDFKLADHSCECCRIALAKDERGRVVAFWRHVFKHSERDHAIAVLDPNGKSIVHRATFDHWQIEACPHHGPGLAIDERGVKHAVWSTQVDGESRAFYGQLNDDAPPTHVVELPRGAMHADVGVAGAKVALSWKRFDGQHSLLESRISSDGGNSFDAAVTVHTASDSDQPHLVANQNSVWAIWRQADEITAVPIETTQTTVTHNNTTATNLPSAQPISAVHPFELATLDSIVQANRGRPFWLVLWDLECPYCVKSLANIAKLQQREPNLRVITIATDSLDQADAIKDRLTQLGVHCDAYAFSSLPAEALRYAIDPEWMGEKPRAYRYDADGNRAAFTGVLKEEQLTR